MSIKKKISLIRHIFAGILTVMAFTTDIIPFIKDVNPPGTDCVEAGEKIKTFQNEGIEVKLVGTGDKLVYVGIDILTGETIEMSRDPDGKFRNMGHTYEILSQAKDYIKVLVVFPKAFNRQNKVVSLYSRACSPL
jgi:hypothetical protein